MAPSTQLTKDQISALRAAICYLRYNVRKPIGAKVIFEGSGVGRDAFNSFFFQGTDTHARSIHRWVSEHLKHTDYDVESWAQSIFLVAFPNHPKFSKSAASILYDVFLKYSNMGEESIVEFLQAYGGVYSVFRYAAHLDTPDISKEELASNAFVVRAAMQIYRDGEVAAFKICYRHSTDDDTQATEISGFIVLIGREEVYFVGIEDQSRYPMIVLSSRRHANINRFLGIVLRRHREDGRILAGRVAFKKVKSNSPDQAFAAECLKVGVKRESEIGDDFDQNIRQRINNKVDYDVKMTLRI